MPSTRRNTEPRIAYITLASTAAHIYPGDMNSATKDTQATERPEERPAKLGKSPALLTFRKIVGGREIREGSYLAEGGSWQKLKTAG